MFHQAHPSDCGYPEGFESFWFLLDLVEHQDLDDNRFAQNRLILRSYTNVDVVLTTVTGTTVTQTGTTTAPVVV